MTDIYGFSLSKAKTPLHVLNEIVTPSIMLLRGESDT